MAEEQMSPWDSAAKNDDRTEEERKVAYDRKVAAAKEERVRPLYSTDTMAMPADRQWRLAIEEAARIVDVHAQEMRNCSLTLTPDGLSAIAKVIRALKMK